VGTAEVALNGARIGGLGDETIVTAETVVGRAIGLHLKTMVGDHLGPKTSQKNGGRNDRHEQNTEEDGPFHVLPPAL
jgi:hypothetical protein